MGTQEHNPVVKLPGNLWLAQLEGMSALSLIRRCDRQISFQLPRFQKDVAAGLLSYYDGAGSLHDALCCRIPRRPGEEHGIPVGLCKWMLRKEIAEAARVQS